MKEIKYRGLVIEPLASGEKWISSDEEYHEIYVNRVEKTAYINGHEVVYESVSEYTGLKDKNGKEIYEGDVLEIKLNAGSSLRCVIEYKAPSFCRRWIDKVSKRHRPSEIEKMAWNTHIIYKIVGNIYENPELLEVSE